MRLGRFWVTLGILAGGACSTVTLGFAQGDTPEVVNAKLDVREAGANLAATIKEIAASNENPLWIGYEVAGFTGEHGDCCGDYKDGATRGSKGVWHLENEHGHASGSAQPQSELKREGKGVLRILYRADKRHIERIRMMSDPSQLDAGGLRLTWLEGVRSDRSVAFLSEFVLESANSHSSRVGEQALAAIAQHADAAADIALAQFASVEQPEALRERASFWMGAARGAAELAQLEQMAKRDPSSEVRAKVSFALFVSKEPGATETMIRMARDDGSPHVRGQALFWLAQKAGAKAANAITGAIANDPDTEVKKKAVLALSQMPKDEGVPKLIEVAENNRNPEVRKQAMFWLGQSEDPRALAFFEKILKN